MTEMNDYTENISVIHLAADHAGYELKEAIKTWLAQNNYEVLDHGAFEYDDEDDYVSFVEGAAREVSVDSSARAIVVGGSGQGEAIVANRFPGVRAVVYYGAAERTQTDAEGNELGIIASTRYHNNANVLSLGARFITEEEALEAIDLWLETAFSNEERHRRRLEKLDELGA